MYDNVKLSWLFQNHYLKLYWISSEHNFTSLLITNILLQMKQLSHGCCIRAMVRVVKEKLHYKHILKVLLEILNWIDHLNFPKRWLYPIFPASSGLFSFLLLLGFQRVPITKKSFSQYSFPMADKKIYSIQGGKLQILWVIFLAETLKDLEIILITTVLCFTNSLSRTSFDFSLKTSFVYSNLFSFSQTEAVSYTHLTLPTKLEV